MNIIILNTRKYDFEDEKTGRRISGIKVNYIFNDTLLPVKVDENEQGYQVATSTLSLDKEYHLKDIPGVYETDFVTRVNAKNQPIQRLVDVQFVSSVPELLINSSQNKIEEIAF